MAHSSRFATVLADRGITIDDVLAASRPIEAWRGPDRLLARARKALRRKEPGRSYADAGIAKPRSGRPLGRAHVQRALAGSALSPHVRAKLMRALGALTTRRAQAPIDASTLFGAPQV